MATTPYPFVSGTVLTASQLNSTFNIPTTTKTASHTLIAADAGTRVIMNSASATTITVNTSIFAASDIVEIQNIGAGVCTITAGTATVSTTGSLALAQNGSGRLVFTAAGTSIFQANGVAASASGLTLIKTQTIGTTVSSVEVTGAFSATYDNYQILISGGLGSVDTADLKLTLGATVTGYNDQIVGAQYTTSGTFAGGTNGSSFRYAGTSNGATLFMNAFLENPFLTKVTLLNCAFVTSSIAGSGFGYLANSTSYTAFTITPSSGTITGGTIRVYGFQNS